MSDRKLLLGHSPDPDDAFMFYGLAKGLVPSPGWSFEHVLQDIQTLNERAMRGELEIGAVSIHAYAYITDRYLLLPHGASMGERYGPRLVTRAPMTDADLRKARIAVPGLLTSAYLALKLWEPSADTVVAPFDEIEDLVARGEVDAGLIIHEGQLTYAEEGLHLCLDFGEWWHGETGLPLPLGGNVIRRDLGDDVIARASRLLRESIRYSLDNREAALAYAMEFARGMDPGLADEFVGMYVNERTLDYGPEGREAVRLFLRRGAEAGLIPHEPLVEFAE